MIRRVFVLASLLGAGSWLVLADSARAHNCIRDVIFTDAVLYAGATDYVFMHPSGALITVRIPNEMSEKAGVEPLMALQSDGPAEANPERLERRHDLCEADGMLSVTIAEPE